MAQTIPDEILTILDSCTVDGSIVRLNCGQLERKTYEQVNKVLEALGGKWNRKAKGHVFDSEPAGILDAAILTGEYSCARQVFGFFETPYELACRVADLAEIQTGHTILEPSAGRGALLRPAHASLPPSVVYIYATLVEIREAYASYLRECRYERVHCTDFLTLDPEALGTFDRVIMNPPFAKQADIDHVMHAWNFVKPGGRLVAIMSAGVAFRENKKTVEMRNLIERYGHFEKNPEGAFKDSGTMVNTITAVMDKPK